MHAGGPQQARVQPPAVLRICFSPLPFRRRLSLSAVVGVTHPSAPAQTAVTSTVLACGPFSPSSSAKRTSEPWFQLFEPATEDAVPVKIDFPAFSRYDEAVALPLGEGVHHAALRPTVALDDPLDLREYSTSLRSMASKASSIAA